VIRSTYMELKENNCRTKGKQMWN